MIGSNVDFIKSKFWDKMILCNGNEEAEEIYSEIEKTLNYIKRQYDRINKILQNVENDYYAQNEDKLKDIICNFIKNNGSVLDKDKQKDLYIIISKEYKPISTIKILKKLNIRYEYINSDKEWKDIKIYL